jgi:prefoldin beta subunit
MQYEMTLRETKRALEELGATVENAVVFLSVGSILIQKKTDEVAIELQEKIDSLELRVASLEKQEKTMSAKVGQLRGQIQNAVASVGNTPTAE